MKITGVLLILLAIVIGVTPLFTDCASQGRQLTLANGRTIPMKCHWTGLAEFTLAVPMLVVGALMAFDKGKRNLRNLNIVSAVLGVFVILLPTALIGVCANPDMLCNSIMRPTLILLGTLVVLLSVFGIFQSFRMQEIAV